MISDRFCPADRATRISGRLPLCVAALVWSWWALAAPPQRLSDLSLGQPVSTMGLAAFGSSSSAGGFTALGSRTVFFASTESAGLEPWISDGSAAGTLPIKDVRAGAEGSFDSGLFGWETPVTIGARVYFAADDGSHGRELWTTDGSAAGTLLLKDIHPDSGPTPHFGLPFQSGTRSYFRADDGVHGMELWTTNGTSAATMMVVDLNSGPASAMPTPLATLGNTLYFVADDGVHGSELWRTDGTAGGTALVKDIAPGAASSAPGSARVVGGLFYFSADDGSHGRELWRSDGTPAGTRLVQDINPGTAAANPGAFRLLGANVMFAATDLTHGRELWTSDGTPAGTSLLADIYPGVSSSNPTLDFWQVEALDGVLYFSADDGVHGRELWRSDGSAANTRLLADIWPGPSPSDPRLFGGYQQRLFLSASDPVHDREAWVSDGTTAGTTLLKEIQTGNDAQEPYLVMRDGPPLILATDDAHGQEFWITDGTSAGTSLVTEIVAGPDGAQVFGNLIAQNEKLYFRASDTVHGAEPWVTDGTASGTQMLKNIQADSGALVMRPLVANNAGAFLAVDDVSEGHVTLWHGAGMAGGATALATRLHQDWSAQDGIPTLLPVADKLYFAGEGPRLWVSDGTVPGTYRLSELWLSAFVTVGTKVLFSAGQPLSADGEFFVIDNELYGSDGTLAGTALVKDLCPGTCGTAIALLTGAASRAYFRVDQVLWRSDGSAAGTTPITTLASAPLRIMTAADSAFFTLSAAGGGLELWVSDGTAGGTRKLRDFVGIEADNASYRPRALGAQLFFSADDGVHGPALWASDGTTLGTRMVKDIGVATDNPGFAHLTAVGATLYFTALDLNHGNELWKTDGSAAGTVLVKDIAPGATWGTAGPLVAAVMPGTPARELLYFAANDGLHGDELWVSDGSPANTRMVEDYADGARLAASPYSSSRHLASGGGRLYMTATDLAHGRQLWSYDFDLDGDSLNDAAEFALATAINDADSDDDGLADGAEDVDRDGVLDPGETDPKRADSDGDGLNDGTERGVTGGVADPDGNGPLLGTAAQSFVADADPRSVTDPLNADSDGDGISDGVEDANQNGALDAGESDPNMSSPPNGAAAQVPLPAWMLVMLALLLVAMQVWVARPARQGGSLTG